MTYQENANGKRKRSRFSWKQSRNRFSQPLSSRTDVSSARSGKSNEIFPISTPMGPKKGHHPKGKPPGRSPTSPCGAGKTTTTPTGETKDSTVTPIGEPVASEVQPTVSPTTNESKSAIAASADHTSKPNPVPSLSASKEDRRKESDEYVRSRDLKRKAFELKNAKIRLALWPSPEAEADIKTATFCDTIDYERLAGSLRFRDAWSDFSKLSHPTGPERARVIRLAIEALKVRPGATRRHDTKKDAKSDKKRARESTGSSSNTETTGSAKKFLGPIPKVKKTQQEDPKATSATGASPEEETNKDIVMDEDDEPLLDTFSRDLGDALPYAEAAKGNKSKKDQPFILFIHKGTTVREAISKAEWKLLLEKVNVQLFEMAIEGKETPKIEWSGHSAGTGLFAPISPASQDILVSLVDSIKVDDQSFRAWPKGAREDHLALTIKLPAGLKSIPSGKIVEGLNRMNTISSNEWKLYNVKGLPDSGQRILTMIADRPLAERLAKDGGYLWCGAGRVEVFYKNQRLC